MDLTERQDLPAEAEWALGPLAYFPSRIAWSFLILGTVLIGLWYAGYGQRAGIIGVALFLVAVAVYGGAYCSHRAVTLYMDASGVWVASGLFPWTRGVRGVKWRDIESIVYITGFRHWVTRSYPVMVVERFTQRREIDLPHVWHGDQAVTQMNERLMATTRVDEVPEGAEQVVAASR